MFALLLAAALVGHTDAGAELLPIQGQADTIELHHEYDARGVYYRSLLIGWEYYGQVHAWQKTCHYPPWFDARWPAIDGRGCVVFEGERFRARRVVQRWGRAKEGYGYYWDEDILPVGRPLVPGR